MILRNLVINILSVSGRIVWRCLELFSTCVWAVLGDFASSSETLIVNFDCIDTCVCEVALVYVVKVQAGVNVKSQLTRLPVPRRGLIQRGGSSPLWVRKD